jgi:hypothetical protein
MMPLPLMVAWTLLRVQEVRREVQRNPDRGAGIVETVIIVGLFAAAAIVIVGILVTKAKTAASNVQTQ